MPNTVDTFLFDGDGQTFANPIVSHAAKTIIKDADFSIMSNVEGMQISSAEITFYNVNITVGTNAECAVHFTNENAAWIIRGGVSIENGTTAAIKADGNLLLATFSSDEAATLNVTGGKNTTGIDGSVGMCVADTLTANGYLTISVYGGDGADGTGYGADGGDGAVALVASNLVVDMGGSLNLYGGNGGNGTVGTKGNDGKTTSESTYVETVSNGLWDIQSVYRYKAASSGDNGGRGGNGGNGCAPLMVTTLNATNGQIQLVYGNGGDGGQGGSGGNGGNGHDCYGYIYSVDYLYFYYPGKGGDAGDGGNGGNAGCAAGYDNTFEDDLITIVSGANGSIGAGGKPGKVGIGGNGGSFGSGTNNRSAGAASDGEPGVSGDDGVVS